MSQGRLAAALSDRYRLERELGEGGMATVYLATDLKHEREVALKVLKPELAAVLGAERFLAEVKITARLHHPHILTLIDSGEADGQLYYVLPYVRGDSLRARLVLEKQLGLDESLRITRQIASALDYAHQQGVIHRDIKPENILFHEGEAMLADFGIALAVKQAGGNRLTETGLSLGTPQYMSPEQATGDRQLDARSDVYSLGAVLYEMLAGEPPVTGPTVQAVIAKLLTEKPTRLRVVRDTVPDGVDTAVIKALAKVPSDRYASAGELSAALDRAMTPSGAAIQRRPAWLLPVGLAAVAAAVATAFVVTRTHGGGAPRAAAVRAQVTFTGNAVSASISPDGSRIAFATRTCDKQRGCGYDVVVQDIGGAGSLTVMRGATDAWRTEWSRDGRYLLVGGSKGLNWGTFVVPATVQGNERYLGCCLGRFLNGSDSVLLSPVSHPGSVQLIRVLTVADGAVHDSIPIRRSSTSGTPAFPSPDGRRIAYLDPAGDLIQITLADRAGRGTDSLRLSSFRDLKWRPDGSGILIAGRTRIRALSDIVFYAIDPQSGRFSGRRDTVVAGLDLGDDGYFDLTQDGSTLQYANGPVLRSVVALTRTDPASTRFTARTLKTSTADLRADLAPSGDRVALRSQIAAGDTPRYQLTMMPFDSGTETLVLPQAEEIVDWVWSATPGADLVYAAKDGARYRYTAFDAATSRSRLLFALPDSLGRDGFIALPDGRFAMEDVVGRKIRVMAPTGQVDRVIDAPADLYDLGVMRSSPKHDDILLVGFDQGQDTILVIRVSSRDGRSERVGVRYGENSSGARQMDDGSIQVAIRENGGQIVLYQFPAGGGAPRKLGVMPFTSTAYVFSSDGRRAIASVRESKADVWLIKNLKDLLSTP